MLNTKKFFTLWKNVIGSLYCNIILGTPETPNGFPIKVLTAVIAPTGFKMIDGHLKWSATPSKKFCIKNPTITKSNDSSAISETFYQAVRLLQFHRLSGAFLEDFPSIS